MSRDISETGDILQDVRAERERELRALACRFRAAERDLRELLRRVSRAVECIPGRGRRRFRKDNQAGLRRLRLRSGLYRTLSADRLLLVAAVAPWSLQRLGGALAEAEELLAAAERESKERGYERRTDEPAGRSSGRRYEVH